MVVGHFFLREMQKKIKYAVISHFVYQNKIGNKKTKVSIEGDTMREDREQGRGVVALSESLLSRAPLSRFCLSSLILTPMLCRVIVLFSEGFSFSITETLILFWHKLKVNSTCCLKVAAQPAGILRLPGCAQQQTAFRAISSSLSLLYPWGVWEWSLWWLALCHTMPPDLTICIPPCICSLFFVETTGSMRVLKVS